MSKTVKIKRDRTWMCDKCTDDEGMPMEFKTFEEYGKHNDSHSKVQEPEKVVNESPTILPEVKEERLKTSLVYRWEGQCGECGGQVETIPLDVDKRTNDLVVVCWCPVCKRKVDQRTVVKL